MCACQDLLYRALLETLGDFFYLRPNLTVGTSKGNNVTIYKKYNLDCTVLRIFCRCLMCLDPDPYSDYVSGRQSNLAPKADPDMKSEFGRIVK